MSDSKKPDLREQLKATLDEAEWSWLAPHLKRDGLILVSVDLDLLEAAEAIARDDKAKVQQWLASGKLGKPSSAQVSTWDATPAKKFLVVVVQPYVLAQLHLMT